MTKIDLNDLPEFLKNSFLYNALIQKEDGENTCLSEDNKTVLLPSKAIYDFRFIKTNHYDSLEEFEKIVYVLNYWVCYELPEDFLDFAENISKSVSKKQIIEVLDKTVFKEKLKHITDHYVGSNSNYFKHYIREGYLDLVKYFFKKVEPECITKNFISNNSIEYGHLDVLKYLHENGFKPDRSSYDLAVSLGHIHILEYLESIGVQTDEGYLETAISKKQLESIKYLHKKGCEFSEENFYDAVSIGDLKIVEYLFNNGCPINIGDDLYNNSNDLHTNIASRRNNLEVLKFLHKNGFPWDSTTVLSALEHSYSIDCLKYLIENNCPYNERYIKNELLPDNLEALKSFFEKGLKLDKELFDNTIIGGNLEVLDFLLNNGCEYKTTIFDVVLCTTYVIGRSAFDFLQLLHKHNFPFDITTTNTAVDCCQEMETMDCLKYLIQNGSPYDESTMGKAIMSNDLCVIQYLMSIGCPIPDSNILQNEYISKKVYSYLTENVYTKNELSEIKIQITYNSDSEYNDEDGNDSDSDFSYGSFCDGYN